MGNTPAKPASSSAGGSNEEIVFTVDSGALAPFGVYNIPQDYDQRVVKKLIVERKLAPFYKGLQDEPEGAENTTTGTTPVNHGVKFTLDRATTEAITAPQSNDDELLQVGGSKAVPVTSTSATPLSAQLSSSMPASALHLAQSRSQLQASSGGGSVASPSDGTVQSFANSLKAKRSFSNASSAANLSKSFDNSSASGPLSKAGSTTTFQQHDVYENIPEELLYKGAIECPICFLYYPRNINYTRCCDQPICTECFVQIKRPEATIDPAECPYCCQTHFGIIYYPLNANRTAHLHDHDDASSLALSDSNGVDMSRRNSSFSHVEMFATSLGSSAGGAGAGKSPLAAAEDGDHSGMVSGSESLTRSEGKRRKSVPHKSPNVVTSDDIRPDWIRKQQQLVIQRAAQQRRMTMMEAALLARAHASDPARNHHHHRRDDGERRRGPSRIPYTRRIAPERFQHITGVVQRPSER
ncbi:hypothetical protein BJ742DRAFT_426197 [Cladochytrium replicatum]|nr:hypothetical protein BJ742DRAFT_426197 [Cladochytrium replicatum]